MNVFVFFFPIVTEILLGEAVAVTVEIRIGREIPLNLLDLRHGLQRAVNVEDARFGAHRDAAGAVVKL